MRKNSLEPKACHWCGTEIERGQLFCRICGVNRFIRLQLCEMTGCTLIIGLFAFIFGSVFVLSLSSIAFAVAGAPSSTPPISYLPSASYITTSIVSTKTSIPATKQLTPTPTPESSSTVIPPSLTPLPSATPTPSITVSVTPICAKIATGLFSGLWNSYLVRLRCPLTSSAKAVTAAEQLFQNGHMFWRQDLDVYYVVYDHAGSWAQYGSKYGKGSGCSGSPPEGYRQPVSGFGNVWCALGGASASIGWALDREYGFASSLGTVLVQDFNGGTIYRDSDGSNNRKAYILFYDGTMVRVNY